MVKKLTVRICTPFGIVIFHDSLPSCTLRTLYKTLNVHNSKSEKHDTVHPGYNQRQGNDSGVSYNRTFLYPGFKRNEIVSRGQDAH